MGLIRSLLVKLGCDNAQFEEGMKRSSHSLYGLTADIQKSSKAMASMGANASMLMRGGIYGALAKGVFGGFTEMIKSAKQGEDAVTGLGRGLYGLVTGIPVVGRIAVSFKELTDMITGAKEAQDAFIAGQKYIGEIKGFERDIKRRKEDVEASDKWDKEVLKAKRTYEDESARLKKIDKDNEKALERRLSLEERISELNAPKGPKPLYYTEMAWNNIYNRRIEEAKKMRDELSTLPKQTLTDEALDKLKAERKESYNRINEGRMGEQFSREEEERMFLENYDNELAIEESKKRIKTLTEQTERIKQNQDRIREANLRGQELHQKHINDLSSRYDTDRMRIEKEYQELLRHRSEVGEAAFGRGKEFLKQQWINTEYARMRKPEAMEINPSFVSARGLAEMGQDILVEKQKKNLESEEAVIEKWDRVADRIISGLQGVN
jgi:hypothetical protein